MRSLDARIRRLRERGESVVFDPVHGKYHRRSVRTDEEGGRYVVLDGQEWAVVPLHDQTTPTGLPVEWEIAE